MRCQRASKCQQQGVWLDRRESWWLCLMVMSDYTQATTVVLALSDQITVFAKYKTQHIYWWSNGCREWQRCVYPQGLSVQVNSLLPKQCFCAHRWWRRQFCQWLSTIYNEWVKDAARVEVCCFLVWFYHVCEIVVASERASDVQGDNLQRRENIIYYLGGAKGK